MSIVTGIEAAAAIVALLVFIYTIAKWVGRVDRNTEATDRLTNSLTRVTDTLLDHEVRITVLEKTKADPDAG